MRAAITAEAVSLLLVLLGIVFIVTVLGSDPLATIGGILVLFSRVMTEPRLAAYTVIFLVYFASLPILMLVVRPRLGRTLLIGILGFVTLQLVFWTLQLFLPLDGREELVLLVAGFLGVLWTGASMAGAFAAARVATRK